MAKDTGVAQDSAGVIVRPPLLFLAGLVLGLVLDRLLPLALLERLFARLGSATIAGGLLLVIAGAAAMAAAMRAFSRAGTPVQTWRPTAALVTTGPYRHSRNPIYLGLCLIYGGLCLLLSSAWGLVLLIAIVLVLEFGVIRREERYLERKFGEPYRVYKGSVRRWF